MKRLPYRKNILYKIYIFNILFVFQLLLIYACSTEELDTDGDGITDDIDLCDNTDTSAAIIGPDGCEVSLFYLADNGVTIKAIENSQVGMQQEFEGNLYTIVSENQLRQMIDNSEDIRFVVTSKISNFSKLFQFKGLPSGVSRWDISNASDLSFMFAGSYGFNLNISNWDVSNVTSMKGMFYSIPVDLSQTTSDNQIPLFLPYDSLAASVLQGLLAEIYNDVAASPSYAPLLTLVQNFFNSYAGPNNSNSFLGLGEAVTADFASDPVINAAITQAVTANVNAQIQAGVEAQYAANGIPESIWETGAPANALFPGSPTVTPIAAAVAATAAPLIAASIASANAEVAGLVGGAFDRTENIYIGSFNINIGGWDVSKVTDMSYMFYHSKFNQNISLWDVSNVTTMKYMLGRGTDFNQNLSNWDVSNVINCSSFDSNSNISWTDSGKPNFTNCSL